MSAAVKSYTNEANFMQLKNGSQESSQEIRLLYEGVKILHLNRSIE